MSVAAKPRKKHLRGPRRGLLQVKFSRKPAKTPILIHFLLFYHDASLYFTAFLSVFVGVKKCALDAPFDKIGIYVFFNAYGVRNAVRAGYVRSVG
jgi:hypothetical protein